MAIFSKKLATERLQMWLDAEAAISTGQAYQIGQRSLTRADLANVRKQIEYWSGKLAEAENAEKHKGRNRTYRFVPRDL